MAEDKQTQQDDEPAPSEGLGDNDSTYEPTREQVNNGRVQGLGVGQKDIDYQRDPTRADSTEKYGKDQ